MPYFYKIDKERRVVLSTASGVFSLADFRSHQEKLSLDPDFDPSFCQIADFTHVTRLESSASDIRQMAERSIFNPNVRRALITPNEVIYGSGRMYQKLRENLGATGIRVFRTLDEALEWVFSYSKAD
jgi:hypothetical protein